MDELPGISSSIQPGWKPRSTAGWKSHVLIHLQRVHFPIELCVLYVYYLKKQQWKKTVNKQQNPWTWLLNLENSDRPHSSYFLFLQLYIAMIVASNRRSNSFFSSSTSTTIGRGRWKTCSGNLDF